MSPNEPIASDAAPPEISVIMPNYDGASLIGRSIASVLSQTFADIELIVIDDGSADASIEIVQSIKDRRVRLIQQSHEGVCAARNRGIRHSRGRFIAFLDSDDTWDRTFLEKLHAALGSTADAALAYCGWQNVGLQGGRGEGFIPPDYETPDKLELWLRNCRWPIHAALTRTDAIKAVGGFDPRFPTSEDFLLWLQIVAENRISLVPEVLAFYHHHGGQRATSDPVRMALNHLATQQEYLRKHPEVRNRLGRRTVRALTVGELLSKGYACYWAGQLKDARRIFLHVMKSGYGNARDWRRMLPSLLPLPWHRFLVRIAG